VPETPLPWISALDHGPVSTGGPPADALAHSAELARLAEGRRYTRFRVAERHGRPWMASSAPAGQFGILEALHPGRIDLGLGRGAGGDQVAAHTTVEALDAHRSTFQPSTTLAESFTIVSVGGSAPTLTTKPSR